ncbi:MAG: iron-containing alcohol dehydrogenase [Deltaproteobacteria bacterium]|nr:iron-containing alcohol dehydrogenase [Deltaproteobacteria bacterium]
MIASFEVLAPRRIVFGLGASAGLATHLTTIGVADDAAILVVTGKDPSRHEGVLGPLRASRSLVVTTIAHEPSVEDAIAAVGLARAQGVRAVIGLGGGSAIDLGKAVSALVTNPNDPLDHLEVVGRGQPLVHDPLPFVAIPTTAGTGAEATKNAVLTARTIDGSPVKVSLRSDRMVPALALIDPSLAVSAPPSVTAATGLDALVQVIEPYVSHAATPFTDALCRDAIPRGARALPRAFANGGDLEARSDMALVSLYGGLALANAKLGAVHGFAGPLGGLVGAPHGAICARLLPFVIETNLAAMRSRATESIALARYDEVARWVTGRSAARADDVAHWAHALLEALAIPTLSAMGLTAARIPEIVSQSARSSSMKGNPISLTEGELHEILERAL